MNYAFAIDNRKCIGCHACSTACKSENAVPIGVHRTWVKYVEKGSFPHTRRYFQVTRCNHCARPPCVPICPTRAMYRRDDGIVEFDSSLCIGCKACLQACPYDAIHIDPDSGTAAKCHFCAHRTDVGLEPACVIVCPVHAIVAGDMDDSASEISRLLATEKVAVRKPEQGTRPKLYYIDGEESALSPMLAAHDGGQLWAEPPQYGPADWRGPIEIAAGKMAGALLRSGGLDESPRETYNVPHRVPWHWQVPAYLLTKAIGAGAFLVAALGMVLGLLPASLLFTTVATILALLMMGLTTGFLVWDLDRPERFWTILVRPQWRSWLARGAFLLLAFSLFLAANLIADRMGLASPPAWLVWPGILLAAASAVYTAFLFAQAEGRDLWQSPLLPVQILVQAFLAGAAALLLLALLFPISPESIRVLSLTMGLALLANLLITASGEFAIPHASDVASAAARLITRGRFAAHYWGSLIGGLLLPLVIVVLARGSLPALAAAGALALVGLWSYEWAYVMAPQQVPNN